jgi:K+-sensing histidine kinase KdpD
MKEQQSVIDMLHDMRSPLAAIMLNVEMLEKHAVGGLTKAQHDVIKAMKESIQKLRRVIDESVVQTICK